MSENEEGSVFKGVQDRLKMFEQSTTNIIKPDQKKSATESCKSNVKSFTPALKTPVPKSPMEPAKPPNRNVHLKHNNSDIGPCRTVTPPMKGPPLKHKLSEHLAPQTKAPPMIQKTPNTPTVKAAPPLKIPPPETIQTSIKVPIPPQVLPANVPVSNIDLKRNMSTIKPPDNSPIIVHVPPTLKNTPSNVTEQERNNQTTAQTLGDNLSAVQTPCEITPLINKKSDHSPATMHPLPPAPPREKSTDKTKITNESKQFDPPASVPVPPPVPPPPPTTLKVQPNVLIGWALASKSPTVEKEDSGIVAHVVETVTANVECNKPPPLLKAPPSIEQTKIQKVAQVAKTASKDDTYDEDDDFFNYPWYFNVSRTRATEMMRDCEDIGKFMVRPSENNQYVLMVRADDQVVKKFKIQNHEDGWVLGDLSNGKRRHASVVSLMDFYCKNGVKAGKITLQLTQPVTDK